jgi:osmotically-inducible protein OsmY
LQRSTVLESDSVRHITEAVQTLRHSKCFSAAGTPLRTQTETNLDVRIEKSDDAVAIEVAAALQQASYWQDGEISASVTHGWVTLSGQIEWDYQKRTAIYAVRGLPGVLGITDKIVLRFAPVSLTSPHVRRQAQTGQIKTTSLGAPASESSFA